MTVGRPLIFLLSVILIGCSPVKRLRLDERLSRSEKKFQDHIGFALFDLDDGKMLFEYQADRYFTPASNTKILTFYTALRVLGDSLPALEYVQRNDSLFFWGTGDPSFFYGNAYTNDRTYQFLKASPHKLVYASSNFFDDHFGKGWAWDDYNSTYSSERSPLPLYGNYFTVARSGSMVTVSPAYFDQFLSIGERSNREKVVRQIHSNEFTIHPGLNNKPRVSYEIPMKMSDVLTRDLLQDTLKRTVALTAIRKPALTRTLFSVPSDSLYKEMMVESDNFIAEQLLLMCSGVVRDSLSTSIAIDYSLRNYMSDLPDRPVWVDGSGLSRYNLITPRSIVALWRKIFEVKPRERLFPLLATGGKNGTIKNWYKADQPYIFGKTGTLSNNHSLSGFLVTRSGKVLIFCLMNNNYVQPTNEVRKEMQDLFYHIYTKY